MRENKTKTKIKVLIFLVLILPLPCLAATAGDVVVNEIMIEQTDATKNEFIELYNTTDNDIDLTKWSLKKKTKSGSESNLVSSTKFTGIIFTHGYFLIAHPDYKETINADLTYSGSSYSISKDNTVVLYDQEENIIDKVGYGLTADFEIEATLNPPADQSIERLNYNDSDNNNADFIILETPTPQHSLLAEEDPEPDPEHDPETEPEPEPESEPETEPEPEPATYSYTAPSFNHPPYAEAGPDITALINQEIVFDGSFSWDPDQDSLEYFWNFGDGATDTIVAPSHIYTIPGQYIVFLQVNDNTFSNLDSLLVNIYNNSVIISEFVPNPEGKDNTEEWIELYNQSDQAANLTGWTLDDQEGGSKPFVFPQNSFIAPRQFLILKRPITKLSLNNDSDEIRLIYPSGEIASQVNYSGKNQAGQSVAFDGLDYFWTKSPTPGLANIISAEENKKEKTTANNPEPIIPEPQTPPTLVLDLTEPEKYLAMEGGNQPGVQSQNLLDKIQPLIGKQIPIGNTAPIQDSNPTIILIISIFISGSLLIIWGRLMMKKLATPKNY